MTRTICPPTRRLVSISSASLRCSRPLCSSQNTGGTPFNPVETEYHQSPKTVSLSVSGPEVRSASYDAGPVPQDPTACRRPDSSRASVPAVSSSRRKHSVLRGKILTWSQCQCSTHERRLTRTGQYDLAALFSLYTEESSTCSLERR